MNPLNTQSAYHSQPQGAPRFDLYRRIHKGIRACMTETMLRIGQLDGGDLKQLVDVLDQVRAMARFCEQHMAHEDDFVHPAMDRALAGASRATSDEHVHHVDACRQIAQLADAIEQAGATTRQGLIEQLYHAVSLFMAETLVHMHAEETENNYLLWKLYDDSSLIAIEHAIVESLTPEQSMESLRWMLPAMNHSERLNMLSGARMGMPAEMFDGMLNGVKGYMNNSEWNKLMAGLYGGQRIAA